MPTLPNFSLKFDEHQLFDLAVKARVRGVKRGYLHKAADAKLKKLVPRWCCLFQNFLFYYESESVTKPTGVVFVEGTVCKPVDQLGRDVEVGTDYRWNTVDSPLPFVGWGTCKWLDSISTFVVLCRARFASVPTSQMAAIASTTSLWLRLTRRGMAGWRPSPTPSEHISSDSGATHVCMPN